MSAPNNSIDSYDPSKWKDRGNYWLYDADQKDPDWLLVRKGRPSGSNCGYLLGHGNPRFGSPQDTVLEITGRKDKVFTAQQRANMDYGNDVEPLAREWYERTRGVKVEELGFVVPKWDHCIGVSVDGVVTNTETKAAADGGVVVDIDGKDGEGMIEIKGPKRMYGPLSGYIDQQRSNQIKEKDYSHLWTTHYDQMQLGMAILGKKWCDYVVYCPPENRVFVQRIPFDSIYWEEKMYKPLKQIIHDDINPLLVGTPYPLMPPS